VARGLHFVGTGGPQTGCRELRERTTSMAGQLIQDWTDQEVALQGGGSRSVKYRVFKSGDRSFLEVRNPDNTPVHRIELPQGIALDRRSFEVLLRYVLVDVVPRHGSNVSPLTSGTHALR